MEYTTWPSRSSDYIKNRGVNEWINLEIQLHCLLGGSIRLSYRNVFFLKISKVLRPWFSPPAFYVVLSTCQAATTIPCNSSNIMTTVRSPRSDAHSAHKWPGLVDFLFTFRCFFYYYRPANLKGSRTVLNFEIWEQLQEGLLFELRSWSR